MPGVTFANKRFHGAAYTFAHLAPFAVQASLNAAHTIWVTIHVTYSCHCFTEEFDPARHLEHHRYAHGGEIRAFDLQRYGCSLQLPHVVNAMLSGKVYRAKNNNYTYVAQIVLPGVTAQPYSVFFDLKKDRSATQPTLRMFIQSAYLKALVAGVHTQSWRFSSLAGQLAGLFEPPRKKPRPQKTPK